jgi:hypothetical protein
VAQVVAQFESDRQMRLVPTALLWLRQRRLVDATAAGSQAQTMMSVSEVVNREIDGRRA